MAMLAEPRRKQRWTLNPRGKQWSEDSNKFGQKMLEKMGWSSGKGLGRNMDGITEHIRARYKNDQGGVGFSDKDRDKQWTQHHAGYSELLQQLQNAETPETVTKNNELSGKSLELKSKQSRARVHYHKFTRGKDVNKYSTKDLANIFGKKDLSEKPEPPIEPIADVEQEPEVASSEPEGSSGTYHGVMTIKGGSIADYFKSKMSSLGRRGVNDAVVRDVKNEPESEDERYVGFGFTSAGARNDENSFGNGAFENRALDTASPEMVTPGKRKSAYVFENAALELGDSPKERTPKRRRSEGPVCARIDPRTPEENSGEREKAECPEEIPMESSALDPAVKKRRKKSKDCCAVNPGFVDEASSPESREIDDVRSVEQFEVSRPSRGLANVALDLSDESSGKKRVTFNDRVEYEIEAHGKKRKSKNAGKLDKFEVDNEKLRKKRKRDNKGVTATIAIEGAFANEALELEILSEEANDNALNERKIRKARRKRERRVSNRLETIEEAPEEDREETKVAEVVTLDDNSIDGEEPEIVDLVTPKRKKKKRRKNTDEENVREDENTSNIENVNDAESSGQEIAMTDENSSKRDKAPKQTDVMKTIEIVDVEDTAIKSKKRKKEVTDCELEVIEVTEELDETAREMRKEKAKKKKSKKSMDKENVRVIADDERVESEKKRKKSKKEKTRASVESEETKDGLSIGDELPEDSPRTMNKSVEVECDETNNEVQSGVQSPWDGKAKISRRIIKALFTRSPVVNFAGSNINEIKGYGVNC